MKKSILACTLALSVFATGCLGPNKTFQNLRDWNTTATEDKWVNEGIFLGLNIIPVYGLCYLADVAVFNAIEFWNGEKP
jgi:hypothetical protein